MFDVDAFNEATRWEGGVTRRLFLAYCGALSATPWLGHASSAAASPSFASYPFTLGVTSGDPDSTSVVLWTRLAPRPLRPDGGLNPRAVEVRWEIANDDGFRLLTPVESDGRHAAGRGY